MKGMTGQRAVRILQWVEGTLKWAAPDRLTAFERELLQKCNDIEIRVNGRYYPSVEVKDIKPEMILAMDDGFWIVDSIHQVENALHELALTEWAHGGVRTTKKQIIRKRYSTRMGYFR